MKGAIQNLVIFKLGWLACILFAAAGKPVLATLAVAAVVLLHLVRAPVPVKEALLLACAGLIGLSWESFMVFTGLITYPEGASAGVLAPYWLVAMWVLFATTINHGFRWIKRNWMLASVFGALGGPMAFLGGSAMGAAQFSNTPLALAVIGLGWAILLPTLSLVADTIIDSEFLEPDSESSAPRKSSGLPPRLGGAGHHA